MISRYPSTPGAHSNDLVAGEIYCEGDVAVEAVGTSS